MCEGVFVCDVLCVCVCVHLVGGFLCLCEYKCVCVYIGKGGRGGGDIGDDGGGAARPNTGK